MMMTCRDEILATIRRLGRREFTPQEVIDEMRKQRSAYAGSTRRNAGQAVLAGRDLVIIRPQDGRRGWRPGVLRT